MAEVVVVSNRGPLSFRPGAAAGDPPQPVQSGGGLAATLRPLLTGSRATWVSASMGPADRRAVELGLMTLDGLELVSVASHPAEYAMAYDLISNATLWFCHHHLFDLTRRPRLDRHWHRAWEAYRAVNRQFAEAVADRAGPGATVLVQDYHLSLMGRVLADERPDLATVHFSHTPWADPSALRVLPEAAAVELLAAMAGFGACGFHTARWEGAFRAAYGDPVLNPAGRAPPPTFVSPLGPDPTSLLAEAAHPGIGAAAQRLAARMAGNQLIVRVDRIEPSKNILRGLWAFEELLETRPGWQGRVTMLVLAYPSREGLAEYLAYRSEIEHTVERVNQRWGRAGWAPVVLDLSDDRHRSVAALQRADVLLVNPLRDGMNLVAKEGPLVNQVDGVLVLSREAGAYEELAPAVLGITPTDVAATAAALDTALSMDRAERAERAAHLRRLVEARPAADWLADQLGAARAG